MAALYPYLKLLHIFATIMWVGGGAVIAVLTARMARRAPAATTAAYLGQVAFVGPIFFAPSALLTLVTGVMMVMGAGLSFGTPWVSAGFGGVLLSFLLGGTLLHAAAKRLTALADEGADPAGEPMTAARRRFVTVSTVNLLVLVGAVAAMVLKPA
ncbi:MAG TPA: DUF2269 family protein [Rhodothermales bacterium]|nr:DUF2269 family protein [Rhodothermales bacterium]